MALEKKENNIFFIALAITVTVFPFVATQNIDCKGKAFHCVNSTHFKICVDLGGGVSTTVDDFIIPCPRNTVCKGSNYFECEYIATTTLKSTQKSEVPNDISMTPSLKNVDIATTIYNKTSQNKLSEIIMSTIPSSTLELMDLTTESALQNITSDFSDSDKYRLRETTIEEQSTTNEELTPPTFAKVTLDNIECNDKVYIKPIKYNNTSGTEIGNDLSNSSLSRSFNEDYKISDIENSTGIFIDFSSKYNAKKEKDYENPNIEQLHVTVVKNTIFGGFTNSFPIDYTTEIDHGSYNSKSFVNGASIESEITTVSYNKTSNRSISLDNINNFTEAEPLSLVKDKTLNLINVTTDKISVQRVNNAEFTEIGQTIIDSSLDLPVLDIGLEHVTTLEVYKNNANNGSPKDLSEIRKAVKYTATDKNISYNPVTVTEPEFFFKNEKIDNTITDSPNINNNTSWLNNNTEEGPNLNYSTVDLLQNSKKSTLNDVKTFKNISSDEQLLTTEATEASLISNNMIPNLNLTSQLEHEGTSKDSFILEYFNNTLSKNSSTDVSLSTISSLKLEEKENTEIVRDMSYTTEPSPKLKEISSHSTRNSMEAIHTEATKMTDIYNSLKDQNTYLTPTLHKDEYSTEPTTAEYELNSEVLTSVKDTTMNDYNDNVTIVPYNIFISTEKVAQIIGSNIDYNVYNKKSGKLSTTQADFHYFSSNELLHKGTSTLDPIELNNDNIFVSLYQFGNTTVQDIEPKNNITNNEIEVYTGNYNNISNRNYINDTINSDAITIERKKGLFVNYLRTNFPNENKNIFNTFDNFNITDVFNTSLIEPRINFTGNTRVLTLDTTTKMPIENIHEKRTDIVRDFGLELEQNEKSTIKMSDGLFKDSNSKIFRQSTENIENRKQLIFTNTEMGDINGNEVTEINMNIFGGTNGTIENSVNNPTSSRINITKENNAQILRNINKTDHMNVNYIDNNENIHLFNNIKISPEKYTTPFMDTTAPIFSVANGTEITTEMYNNSEYNSLQLMMNDTTVNDIIEMVTLKNSDIIDLNVAAEIILPQEIITKKASENTETNKGTLINVIENASLDQNNITNKQNFNKTKFIENSTMHNKTATSYINNVKNILKETNNISLLEKINNTIATVTDTPSYDNNVSKEKIMNNNSDVKLHFTKNIKEVMHTSYNIEARAMHSNDNINTVNVSGSDHSNKQISNNSLFKDVDINTQKNINSEIKEMKLIEIEDTLKRDKNFNEENTTQTNGYAKAKEIELIDDRPVVKDRFGITDGGISKYNKTIVTESKLTTNNTLLDNPDNIANLLAKNTTSMSEEHGNNNFNNGENNIFSNVETNATKSNKTFFNEFGNKKFSMNTNSVNVTKSKVSLPQSNITDISYKDILHNTETNNSITHKNVLDIVFTATQPAHMNFTSGYKDKALNSFKYDSVSQQDLSVTRQSDDSRLLPAESETFSTTSANTIRDDLLNTEITSHLIKDNADVPQIPKTEEYDFTTSPYEEKYRVTHFMNDITNIEENKNGNIYIKERQTNPVVATTIPSLLSVTIPNIRQIPATQPADVLKPIACKISHGKYPDENDCNKFYICLGKKSPIIGKCPIGTVFSDIKKQCTNNLSHCIRNNQFKCSAEGRFVDVMSNDYYYICAKNRRGFVRFKLKCQVGYYLNRNTVHCVLKDTFEEDSKNTSESKTKESVSSETFQFTKSFICVNEGKFEFPDDCRKYYVCTKKSSVFRRRIKQCESDEVFDRDRKKCVDDESYECRL